MEELTFEQLYSDLIDASSSVLPEDYFTSRQFAEDAELSDWSARDKLRALVKSGVLSAKRVNINNKSVLAYWFNK